MKDQRLEIKDIINHIDDASLGRLDIPEFQRKFVWRPEKAKDLVDSLWRGYPIGTILLWESKYGSPRTVKGSQPQKLWVVDGQQRITTFSLLFGKKPYWWGDGKEWNKDFKKYDVLVDISKPKDSLEFGLSNPVREKSPQWISVRQILNSTDLSELAQNISEKTNYKFVEIHEKLQSLKKIENYPLYEILIDHEIEDVAQIFTRLNMAGVKVKESDIIIALVAAKQENWVRDEFDHFLKDLEAKGFNLEPAILIRSLAVIGSGIARLKDVPEHFWEKSENFQDGWKKTRESIRHITKKLIETGILSSDLLPSHNALIPLFTLHSKFEKNFIFKKALWWFLLATRDGRYSGAAITTLEQDIKTINSARSFHDAIKALGQNLTAEPSFSKDNFLRNYKDKFLFLIQYLVVFKNQAKDWIQQDIKIGFDRTDNELNEGFMPEKHHFFPKKILKDKKIDESKIDCLANIVVLNEKTNKTFTSKEPPEYLKEHHVEEQRLNEQLIPRDQNLWHVAVYDEFINKRAFTLSEAANKFMKELEAA